MKIAITGSSGFIGRHLLASLEQKGHQIIPVGRRELSQGAEHLASHISGCDAVINLAGAPINKRWTSSYKQEIISSRLDTTRLLVEVIRHLTRKPTVFISTSAIGAFSSHGQYTEVDSPNAVDFLGQLSRDWESAAGEVNILGVRTLIFRLALVLGHDGGLIKQLLPPFRMCLGGPIGDGSQHFSWIHIDDLVNAYLMALDSPAMAGTYHLSAPDPVSNQEFARTLGAVLRRPAVFHMPASILKLAFGEGAEVMTSGQWVTSERLPASGFSFLYPEITDGLRAIVEKSTADCPAGRLFSASVKS